jgi:hypothetical protein
MNNINMNPNAVKRLKKFTKEMSLYIKHPNYDEIKQLYINNLIKTITSAENMILKIKITKKGTVDKRSSNQFETLNKLKDELNIIQEEKKKQAVIKRQETIRIKRELKEAKLKNKQDIKKMYVSKRIIKLDYNKIKVIGYGYLTNKIEFDKLKKAAPGCYYIQTVKYYDNKGNIINRGQFKNKSFDYSFINSKQYKEFIKRVDINMSSNVNYEYLPTSLINRDMRNYTIIETTAYKKEILDKNLNLKQIYKDNDNGHCVYDAYLNYFNILSEKNKNAKAIYNKLLNNEDLKRPYTDENINLIASFCNSSLKIRDLINGDDKFFKNDHARFYVELLNTKYNHLDLLTSDYNEVEEVENFEEMEKIRDITPFYIEKYGSLITLDKTYKIKNSNFKIIYNEWKDQNNYNSLFIDQESDIYKFISSYDYTLHTFFNKFEVNDNLYDELDITKAYYNYSNIEKNKYYLGVPSGSFVSVKCDERFNIKHFNKMTKNKLLGYFEVVINKINDKHNHFLKLGLIQGSRHTLTTSQIKLLKYYIDFTFINCCYSPAVDIPFNEKFLEVDNETNIKYYCKAFGLMLATSSEIDITIKPLNDDKNYYNTIYNDNYDIYKVNNLVKVSIKDKLKKSYCHIAYFIHAYTRTLIMDQLLNMNIDDVFGVKLDSIIVKKNSIYDYNKNVFGDTLKKCNIESMFKIINTNGLDFGLNNNDIDYDYISSYYRPYFEETHNEINFNEPFLYTGDYILNRVVYIGGAGGAGKTTSILKNLNNKNICYTTSCWNLIQGIKNKYPDILGYSLPNLTGQCGSTKTEKIKNTNLKHIVIDENTLNDANIVNSIINDPLYKHCFIFLLGDVNFNGFFYQCSLPSITVLKPCDINCQYIEYTKTFRFNEELNKKLQELRNLMAQGLHSDRLNYFVANNFNYYNKEEIIFNDNDIGISAINDYDNNNNKLTEYFINKGTTPQYFIKTTNKATGQLKGAQILDKPTHKNYECKLFKTIHSFQGLDLNENNKIIISITKDFDYRLLYTALSRARRVDQIYLIKNDYNKKFQKREHRGYCGDSGCRIAALD